MQATNGLLHDPVCGMEVESKTPFRFTYNETEYLFVVLFV